MDRLTRKSQSSEMVWFVDHDNNNMDLEPCEMSYRHNMLAIQKLAYYEDLEEQSRIVELPCKEGTTIYQACYKCICALGHEHLHSTCNSPIECRKCGAVKIERWVRETTFCLSLLDRMGVDFFITREEAEAALNNI